MAKYKLKADFINGVLPNTNGKPNIIFKKGDIIDGTITEKFVFNSMKKGIMSKPTVAEARVENSDGLVFVPISNVDLVNQPVVNTPALPTKGKESLFKKISGSYNKNLIIAVVLVAGYFAYKKFKK